MINAQDLYQKELLKGYGFTKLKALRLFLFSLVFASVALSVYCFLADKAFVEVKKEVNKEVVASLTNLNALYQDNYNYKEYLVEAKSLKFKSAKKVGPKDLSLTRYAKLERVKGQKRKLSANQYEIRFVRTQ